MSYDFSCNIVEVADDFYEAYKRCIEVNKRIDDTGASPSIVNIPAIVNGSFALELYLKSLIHVTDDKVIKTHDLLSLFSMLDPTIQKEIKELVERQINTERTFEDCLKGISDAFFYWRYIYEKEDFGFGLNNTLSVLPVLLKVVYGVMKYQKTNLCPNN